MLAAAVLGSPIDHSLSPLLHESAYRALGLNDWTYTQIECTASDLPRIVSAAAVSYTHLTLPTICSV